MTTRIALAALPLALALTSCRGGVELSAVWSDDGEYHGLLAREYDVGDGIFGSQRDYQRWWVEYEDRTTGERRGVSQARDGAVLAQPFYFMKRAGYFLVLAADDARAFQVELDGTVRELPMLSSSEGCPTITAVPSPTGALIARVTTRRMACMDHTSTATAAVDVELLDATTLALAAAPVHLQLPAAPSVTWTPEGVLVLSSMVVPDACVDAWAITVDGPPARVAPPGCTYPPTSSSPISARGTIIDVEDDDRLVEQPAQVSVAFGCQDGAPHHPSCVPLAQP